MPTVSWTPSGRLILTPYETQGEWFVAKMVQWFGPYPRINGIDEREYVAKRINAAGLTDKEVERLITLCIDDIEREHKRPPSPGKLKPFLLQIAKERPPKPPKSPYPSGEELPSRTTGIRTEEGEKVLREISRAMTQGDAVVTDPRVLAALRKLRTPGRPNQEDRTP